MKFRDEPQQTVLRHWMCDANGCRGEMLAVDRMMLSYPPQYGHACDQCGREGMSTTKFPAITHVSAVGGGDLW